MAVAKTGHCSGNLWQLHAEPFTFRLKGIYLGLGLSLGVSLAVALATLQQQQEQHCVVCPALSKSAAAAAAASALAPANEVRRRVLEMLQNANKLLL